MNTTAASEKIGFIGLGLMGEGFTRLHFVKAD